MPNQKVRFFAAYLYAILPGKSALCQGQKNVGFCAKMERGNNGIYEKNMYGGGYGVDIVRYGTCYILR